MDRRAFIAAALAAIAGCGSDGENARTVAPQLRGVPSPPPPQPTPTPRSVEEDRKRSVVLANRTTHSTGLRLQVRTDYQTVLETVIRLSPIATIRIFDVFEPSTAYYVTVRTNDGRLRWFTWTISEDIGNLHLGIGPEITVRNAYRGRAATTFVAGDSGVIGTAGRSPASLFVENPGPERRVQLAFSDGDDFGDATLTVPAGSLLRFPITLPSQIVEVVATVADTEALTTWNLGADEPLYLTVDGPRFLCDPLFRDLRIENETTELRSVALTVAVDGRTAVDESVTLAAGETRLRRAAVPPAGNYTVTAATEEERTSVEFSDCPPVGPFVVAIEVDGIDVTAHKADVDEPTTVKSHGQ